MSSINIIIEVLILICMVFVMSEWISTSCGTFKYYFSEIVQQNITNIIIVYKSCAFCSILFLNHFCVGYLNEIFYKLIYTIRTRKTFENTIILWAQCFGFASCNAIIVIADARSECAVDLDHLFRSLTRLGDISFGGRI